MDSKKPETVAVGSDGLLGFRLFGAQARDGATKLFKQPVEWEVFSKTFGWFQYRNKNNYTPEQIAAIEDGYRNYQAGKRRVRKPNNPGQTDAESGNRKTQ